MDKYTADFDKLTLLFLFDSQKEKSQQVINQVIVPIVSETKDLYNTYAYDCRDPIIKERPERFQACNKPDELPYIWLLKPPLHRVDPITLEKVNPESIPYNSTELSPTMFYNYIVNNLPDFTERLETLQ